LDVDLVKIAGTWNTSASPTALELNLTNTSSGASSKLFDFQIGGIPRFDYTIADGAMSHKGVTGEATAFKLATAQVTCSSGATCTSSNQIPAGSLVTGVTVRVTTLITGATSISIGDGTDADRWGTGIAVAANTTTSIANFTITTPVYYAAATNVVLTAAGSDFTAGAVRITVHYMSLSAPTS
jgi:hypothetical protein